MSQDVISTCRAISSELSSIRVTMTLYFQLFCNDDETTELLNRAAGTAFARIKLCIARDLLLSVVRLCDPADSPVSGGRRDNCTFLRLINLIEIDGRPDLVRLLKRRFEKVTKKRCEPLIVARHRRLAHNNHMTKLSEVDGRDILPGVTIRDVNKIIRSMRKLLARVATSYRMADVLMFETFEGPRFGNEISIHGRDFRYLNQVPERRKSA